MTIGGLALGTTAEGPPRIDLHAPLRPVPVPAQGPQAVAAGSIGRWEPGAVGEFQLRSGRRLAEADGGPYESFGAAVG